MLSFSRMVAALLTAVGLIALSSCASPQTSTSGADGTNGAKLSIVVAFYPYQFVAERIAGDTAEVQNLTTPGAEPHDLELTGRQVAAVTDADLVIYEKTFQAAVDEAVAQSGQDNTLDTATVVPLQAGSADEHGQEGDLDPHTWLDPTNLAKVATAVADRLSAVAPQNQATYRANATTLIAELDTLDQSFTTGLKTCQRTEFITTHAAFGYLARRYGLEQVGISGLSPDAEPSPARIAEVQKVAEEHGATTIFYETLISPAVATSIADDLGLDTDVLDPLEGITDQSRGTDYLLVMTANLAALRRANACR